MNKNTDINVTSSVISSQQLGHNHLYSSGPRPSSHLQSSSRHENSQQPPQQQFIRPTVYSQTHLRQAPAYPPGTGLPPTGLVHDMNKPFPQQQGLAVTASGQQSTAPAMVYSGQHMATRPQLNAGATSAPIQQPHTGQQYFPRGNGSGGTGGGAGSNQSGNQGQPRHVQQNQRPGGMNMPMMIPGPQGGASQNQQNFYSAPPGPQMYLQPHMGQPTHVIYQQQQTHHPSLPGPVEFPSTHEALSVSMIPSHSSSARYTIENGDLNSPAMSYRYSSTQYGPQPTTTVYMQPTNPQFGHPYTVYTPQVLSLHAGNNRPGMVPPVAPSQPQAPAKRVKSIIRIVDPNTQMDVTDDVLSNAAGNNATPPASGASSARGTPPSNVATPPPDHSSDIAATFARQVAAAAASSAGPSSTATQPAPPPQMLTVSTQPPSSAATAANSVSPQPVVPAITTPAAVIPNRTKNEKESSSNIPRGNIAERQVNNVNIVNDTQEINVGQAVVKEATVTNKIEIEVPPPIVVKTVEKVEIVQPPHLSVPAHSSTSLTTSSSRSGVEIRDSGSAVVIPSSIKKPDSAPPPPFPSKIQIASEVNAPVPPFGAMTSSHINATEKMTGTPPGSSQVIISAPPDHPPSRSDVATEHGPLHTLGQGVVPPPKVTTPVGPVPFTQQQQGPTSQPGSSRPPLSSQPMDTGRLSGHHYPPVTPSPFGQAQQQSSHSQVPSQVHKQQNGEAEVSKPTVADAEGPTKDGKQQQAAVTARSISKRNKDVKNKNESKEISTAVDITEERNDVPVNTTVLEAAEVAPQTVSPPSEEDLVSPAADEEGKATEEMLDKEAKRKVAEKNEENSKVSNMTLEKIEQDTMIRVINDYAPSNKKPLKLKYEYREDQWSPINLEGKKQYDRDFLLRMQNQPPSLKKPEGLPNLEVIRDDVVNPSILDRLATNNISKSRGPVNDFIPVFVHKNTTQTPLRGRSSQQNRKEAPPQLPKKVLSISLCQEVKLRDADDPWMPSYKLNKTPDEDGAEKLYRKVRALLNKLTPQNFSTLMNQASTLGIDSEEKLKRVIDLVFEKAIDEPSFSVAYANMCKSLSDLKVQSSNSSGVRFKQLIIGRCQTEFEKDANEESRQREEKQKMIDAETDPEKKKVLQEELKEAILQVRRRSLGNIRFIGELYKLKILTGKIMHECVKKLLSENDEESLECLCRLLTTIGKDLEYPQGNKLQGSNKPQPDNQVAEYFQKMEGIVAKRLTSSRVRFMLLDVIDLRQQQWVPRRDENNPKTIDQIHREAEAEEQEKHLMYQSSMGKRNDDRVDRRGGGGGGGMGGKRGSNENEGWNTVGRKTSINLMPDTSKCRMRMENLDENTIQLGPQTSGWSKGSMGGKSSHEGDRVPQNSGVNRYLPLSDHSQMDSRRIPPRQQAQPHSMPGRDGRNMGGNANQQLSMQNHRSAGGYKGSLSREHEQAIAHVKNIANNNDGVGRSTSLIVNQKPPVSSRSSSITREAPREEIKVEECDMGQLDTKIKNTIEEYLNIVDINDALLNVNEYVPVSKMPYFVTYLFNQFLEKSTKARVNIGQLLLELVKRNKLSVEQFLKGFNEILESAEDLAIDIPKFWEYLAEIISPIFIGKALNLAILKDLQLTSHQISILLANVLKVVSKSAPNEINHLWRNSGLRLNQLVPAPEVEDFIKQNELHFLQEDGRSATIPFLSRDKIFEGLKQELKAHVCGAGSISQSRGGIDKIFNWISDHVSEQQQKDPSFIRALVSAIADQSVELKNGSYELKVPIFELCCTVIKRYTDNQDKLELETLFALQSFVHRLEHPKSLLCSLFHTLYDKEVVSDEGFQTWKVSGQEVEGHAVAVKAVNSFLNNLSKQSEEEDEST